MGKTKKKRKIRVGALLLILAVVFLVTYLLFYLTHHEKQKTEDALFTCCKLTHEESKALLEEEAVEEIILMKEVLYYGEHMNLYQQEYQLGSKDSLLGYTIIAENLCDGTAYEYLNTGTLDSQIFLGELKEGIYAVSVSSEGGNKKRVVFEEPLHSEIYLVRRSNGLLKVTVIADKDYFTDVDLKRDQLYVLIEEAEEDENIYDVILDPAYGYDRGDYVEKGGTYNGINTSEETYRMALLVKEELEKKGLKVFVTRKNSYTLSATYGEDGRLKKAYDAKGKYMFVIDLNNQQTTDQEGLLITVSSYCSSANAESLSSYLLKNTKLIPSASSERKDSAIVLSSRNSEGYDANFVIRESGGKILGAALTNEKSKANASFAQENIYGIHTINISYAYLNNASDAQKYKENADDYAVKTAEAILDYLGVK